MAQTGAAIVAPAQWGIVGRTSEGEQLRSDAEGMGMDLPESVRGFQGEARSIELQQLPWRQRCYDPRNDPNAAGNSAARPGKFAAKCAPFSQRIPGGLAAEQVSSVAPSGTQVQSRSFNTAPAAVVQSERYLQRGAPAGAVQHAVVAPRVMQPVMYSAEQPVHFVPSRGWDQAFQRYGAAQPDGGVHRSEGNRGRSSAAPASMMRSEDREERVDRGRSVVSSKGGARDLKQTLLQETNSANRVARPQELSPKKEPISANINETLVKTDQDKLYYSKKSRKVEYKPYTTKQYLLSKPKTYYELGKLQADLNRSDLVERRERRNKAMSFAKKLQKQNAEQQERLKKRNLERRQRLYYSYGSNNDVDKLGGNRRSQPKALSARERALQFAKTIPKPRVKSASPRVVAQSQPKESRHNEELHTESDLEELERQHDSHLMQIERIKREYNRS